MSRSYMGEEIGRILSRSITWKMSTEEKRKALWAAFEQYEGRPPRDGDEPWLDEAWQVAKDRGLVK